MVWGGHPGPTNWGGGPRPLMVTVRCLLEIGPTPIFQEHFDTLQGHLVVVGHCRDTWWLGTAGTLGGWALQGHLVVGHCRDTWWLGTAGLVIGHCRNTWWLGTEVCFQSGEYNIFSKI